MSDPFISLSLPDSCPLQNKLRQLDDKQQELIRDNLELKELCLYLDEERANALQMQNCTSCGAANGNNSVLRDDGDGSSSSTNADEPIPNNMHNYEQNLSVSSDSVADENGI